MNPANQDFRVTADGRVLVGRETLDRETTSMYLFTVVAADSGKPSLSATAQVSENICSDVLKFSFFGLMNTYMS